MLTGDTLFIGDVGRPDLSDSQTPQELARHLFDSLREKILKLPDETLVYPAHGAGSMCGRNISADRNSTIGRERRTNYALQPMERETFVEMMTQDLPPRPEYFQRDVDYNRHGAAALEDLPPLVALSPLPRRAVRVNWRYATIPRYARSATEYASGHIPRSIQIGLGGQFASWAGSLLGLDRDLILVAEDRKTAEEARMRLARVGIERVEGAVDGGIAGWAAAGLPLSMTQQITVQDLQRCPGRFRHLGRAPRRGIQKRPYDGRRIASSGYDVWRPASRELDRTRPAAVHCKGGYRSAIACSVLEAAGFEGAVNVIGGIRRLVGRRISHRAGCKQLTLSNYLLASSVLHFSGVSINPMEALLWILLPGFVAVAAGVLAWFVMQSRMEVALANQRESLAETRGALEVEKAAIKASFLSAVRAAEETARRQAFDSFLGEITVEQRHYTRENRRLEPKRRSLVLQERMLLPQSAALRLD